MRLTCQMGTTGGHHGAPTLCLAVLLSTRRPSGKVACSAFVSNSVLQKHKPHVHEKRLTDRGVAKRGPRNARFPDRPIRGGVTALITQIEPRKSKRRSVAVSHDNEVRTALLASHLVSIPRIAKALSTSAHDAIQHRRSPEYAGCARLRCQQEGNSGTAATLLRLPRKVSAAGVSYRSLRHLTLLRRAVRRKQMRTYRELSRPHLLPARSLLHAN